MPTPEHLWAFLPLGYLLSVAFELPVLLFGLSAAHSRRRRVAVAFWLTACTYPVVVLVLPFLVWEPYGRTAYLFAAETFAPVVECALFYLAFDGRGGVSRGESVRDMAAIVVANLASFTGGEMLLHTGWFS